MTDSLAPLTRLMSTLTQRAQDRPPKSYTTKLMEGGAKRIGEKILEEAAEMIEAADESGESGREHFVYEAGDLIYHAMVLLAFRGVTLDEVADELARREGTSGLQEKASRTSPKNNEPD
ncbi:MAG: phosphoribosyl-ATP diphosphatase [Planctomycetota bacterium]